MFIICCISAALAYPVLSWWISIEFAQKSLLIVLILSVGIWLNSLALVPYTLLHAHGNPRLTAFFHMGELVFYILVLWLLTTRFGLEGASLAWVIRVMLDLVLLHIAANKFLHIPK